MQTINEVSQGTKCNPSCRQDGKANRQTTLCHTSFQQNKGVRPATYQPSYRPWRASSKIEG